MKKLLTFFVVLSLILCCGCRKISDLYRSDTYNENDYANSEIDSILSDIEAYISQSESTGEVTVSSETSTYITDADDNYYNSQGETGKQTLIISGDLSSEKPQEIEESSVNTKGSKPLYYNYLNDIQKQIYRFMKTAAENRVEDFFSVGAVSSKENNRYGNISIAFRALSADNPQLFWLPDRYITTPDVSAVAFSYHEKDYNIDYSVKKSDINSMQNQIDNVVSKLVAEAEKLNSRFEKELYFHDWLCNNVTYAKDGTNDVYSVYGALVKGVAVCEGYSRAMQLLCDKVGIPCTVVYGKSNGNGHMWNIIDPGDGWYHLDVTWDDDAEFGVTRHAYFNVSDSIIKKDHTVFEAMQSGKSYGGSDYFNIYLYTCNSENYNYFVKKKLVLTDDMSKNATLVYNAVQNNNPIEVAFNNCNSESELKNMLNEINSELYKYNAFAQKYSPLGNAVVLWLTFL